MERWLRFLKRRSGLLQKAGPTLFAKSIAITADGDHARVVMQLVESIPGGRIAVGLLDIGLTIAGGPARAALGAAVGTANEHAVAYLTDRFERAAYVPIDAQAGGIGGPFLLTIATSGVGGALKLAGTLGTIRPRNAHAAETAGPRIIEGVDASTLVRSHSIGGQGPDQQVYALAQGPLVVGGHQFEAQLNSAQRNYPTTGRVILSATIERAVDARLVNARGEIAFLLAQPDFETAHNIAEAVVTRFGPGAARVENADRIIIAGPSNPTALARHIASIEGLTVRPARQFRVVVNERTGTVVAGADVTISPAIISQGDIRVQVETRNEGSQPSFISGLANDISSLVITNTRLEVDDDRNDATIRLGSTTVGDLVQGLSALNVNTRRMISILQALRSAGALHAELIVE